MSQTPNPMQRKSVLPEFLKNMFGGQGQQDGPMTPQTSPNLGMGAQMGGHSMTPPMGDGAGYEAQPADKNSIMSLFHKLPRNLDEMPGRGQGMGQGAKAASKQDPMDAMSFQQNGMDPRKRFSMRPMLMP